MGLSELMLLSAATILIYMTFVFFLAVKSKNNSLADVAWGPGFVIVAVVTLIAAGGYHAEQVIVTLLVFFWGVRLAIRIFRRNRGKGEDYRYVKWRGEWGKGWVWRSYLQVFLLQGLFMWLISLPILFVNARGAEGLTTLAILGILVWVIGFAFEATGDFQLDSFLKVTANRGKIMDNGLWRYSRHPNYFGEVLQWWGIFIISLSVPGAIVGIIGPLTITFLILRVSGIPLLEKKMAENPAFQEYKARTSVFIPWFPQRNTK